VTEALEPGRTPEIEFAEKSVLGTIITDCKAAEAVLEVLDQDDMFGNPTHSAVCAAVRYVTEEGRPHDLPTILARLIAVEQGDWRTGIAGVILADLMRHATPSFMVHAATVAAGATIRRTCAAAATIAQMAAQPGFTAAESGDLVRKVLDDALAGSRQDDSGVITAADLFDQAMDRLESSEPPGAVRFPWEDLQAIVPYLRPGQLVTIGARPSHGKSLVAQDLARHTGVRNRIPSVLFTLEMDRDEVMDRLLAAESGILLDRILNKNLDEMAWAKLSEARERFTGSKLLIDDTPKVTLAHIRARLRGMASTDPAQLAIVDYLQLMGTAPSPRTENRQQEVSTLVSGLKGIAREFRIPVVMLVQLNRATEGRADRRPVLSDARESGAIENDSDVAILIHRPDFYDPESPRAGEVDLIVDKNRSGKRATATIGIQGHYARLVDPRKRPWSPTAVAEEAA
jgi:replicative DNA helicase